MFQQDKMTESDLSAAVRQVRSSRSSYWSNANPVQSLVKPMETRLCAYATDADYCVVLIVSHPAHTVLDPKDASRIWVVRVRAFVDQNPQFVLLPECM